MEARLAIRYIDKVLPDKSEEGRTIFRQRGAYARFKDLLERKALLERWYQYEAEATERALREWANDEDLKLDAAPGKTVG